MVNVSAVAAVIAAFEPDADALSALTSLLLEQQIPVLVVDDGSSSSDALDGLEALGASVTRHETNAGIARSLNDGMSFAASQGATWLLTVDQDTVLPEQYVASLLDAVQPGVGVIGAETIGDVAGDLDYPTKLIDGVLTTAEVFQTGALWSVSALQMVGGFDESFGIDGVDAAACLALREAGFLVALAPGVRLEHHYGSGRAVRLLGRSVWATGHSPSRRETMVRNRLRLLPREFRQSPTQALRSARRLGMNVLLAVTVEDDRWAKAKGAARGLRPPRPPE